MASTVSNGNDRSEKWQRPFQMATTVYEREISAGDLHERVNQTLGRQAQPSCIIAVPVLFAFVQCCMPSLTILL